MADFHSPYVDLRFRLYIDRMEATNLPDALVLIMESRGWSQSRLARKLGISQAFVSQLVNRKRDVAIGKVIRYLARVGWQVRITPKAEEEGPLERREFTTMFLPGAASLIFVSSDSASPFQDAGYVRGVAKSLAHRRYELGGVPLVDDALGHLARTRRAAMGEPENAALMDAAATLSDQVALVLYDAGRIADAERAGKFGLGFADRSPRTETKAQVLDTLSRVASYQGDWGRGVAYARHGLSVRDVSHSQRASLNMRLGRALAPIPGQEAASREALEHALGCERLPAFSRAALTGDVGIGFGRLRQYDRAGELLGEAAARIGEWSPLFQAQYVGRQAQAALRAGDPALAAVRMEELARALPFVSSARTTARVAEILASSRRWAHVPVMRHAREYLRSVVPQTA